MSPKYTLHYFSIRALGEPIRLLLSYGGQEFDDKRFELSDWYAMKKDMPMGKVPVLEIDDDVIHQSVAICRYFARKFNLVGDDDWDALQADIAVDTINDMKQHIYEFFNYNFYSRNDEVARKKKLDMVLAEILPFYLPKLEELVKENRGYFVNGKLTWADVYWASQSDTMSLMMEFNILKDYPELQAVQDRVLALPGIKEWVEKRPKNDNC